MNTDVMNIVMDYQKYLKTKHIDDKPTGLSDIPELNPMLFDFQKDIVSWALKRGRASIFADCGMGKTAMQLEWAQHVDGKVLIVAPLAVSRQTSREAAKFNMPNVPVYRRSSDDIEDEKMVITNYDMLHEFDMSQFNGIVLDESSILKNHTGAIRNKIISETQQIPFRLACTATPAPNDFMELGNHAEFMGVMSRAEMLAMFFIHDGGDTAKWRLKGHGAAKFFEWVASWAVMITKPSDLGYDDGDGYKLPQLLLNQIVVESEHCQKTSDTLFAMEAQTLLERNRARKESIESRCKEAAKIINGSNEQWVVWCNLNDESVILSKLIDDAVEVAGRHTNEYKEKSMLSFSDGDIRVLVSKPKIAGLGMNWQNCNNTMFVGLSDSWEAYYQAIRRFWRFGQKKDVNVHIITADTEGAVVSNIMRKEADAQKMQTEMVKHMKTRNKKNIKGMKKEKSEYKTDVEEGKNFTLHLGDCVDVARQIEPDSVGFSIFSPPFASLYTYSNSDRDMGNAKSDEDFMKHFNYLVDELYRILIPGRLVAFHCMNIPSMKERDGYIGLKDFRGDLIRCFQDRGFIFHSEVCIWKDPLTEATRTKALGLMHKQLCKDSAMCRQGIPDYLIVMRKKGNNPEPVHKPEGMESFSGENEPAHGVYSHEVWRRYASPVWMDIRQTRTLAKEEARDNDDERHICPLQLDVIERAIQLWTNENDLVFSPFTGIGSEGYVSLNMNREFIGSELKESYFKIAKENLHIAESKKQSELLFA